MSAPGGHLPRVTHNLLGKAAPIGEGQSFKKTEAVDP